MNHTTFKTLISWYWIHCFTIWPDTNFMYLQLVHKLVKDVFQPIKQVALTGLRYEWRTLFLHTLVTNLYQIKLQFWSHCHDLDTQKIALIWHGTDFVKLEINKISSYEKRSLQIRSAWIWFYSFALFTHNALAYTLCILTECSPTQHLTSLVHTQEDHHTWYSCYQVYVVCYMSFYSCFSSCLLACSLFIATRCTFQRMFLFWVMTWIEDGYDQRPLLQSNRHKSKWVELQNFL